jgi:hypothetical protein
MDGGSLSDQQLKEFDAYLSGDNNNKPNNTKPDIAPIKPQPPKADADFDSIVKLHKEKVNVILDLLDKIDAKSHKDIVADLVDEMQYQKSIIKREQEQGANLKKLITLANEAAK